MMAAGFNITSVLRVVEPVKQCWITKNKFLLLSARLATEKCIFLTNLCFYRKGVSNYFYNYFFFQKIYQNGCLKSLYVLRWLHLIWKAEATRTASQSTISVWLNF